MSLKGESKGPWVGLDATTVFEILSDSSLLSDLSKGWAGTEEEAEAKSDAEEESKLFF